MVSRTLKVAVTEMNMTCHMSLGASLRESTVSTTDPGWDYATLCHPIRAHLEPMSATSFGNRVFEATGFKMKMMSFWVRVGPESNMTGTFIRKEHHHTERTPVNRGTNWSACAF